MNTPLSLVGLVVLIALTSPNAFAEKGNADQRAKGTAHEGSVSVEHQQKAATKMRVDEEKRALQESEQIKETYRGDRENRQEETDLDRDDEASRGEPKKKAKKPWWKFWGD